jgi:hypothetical protein
MFSVSVLIIKQRSCALYITVVYYIMKISIAAVTFAIAASFAYGQDNGGDTTSPPTPRPSGREKESLESLESLELEEDQDLERVKSLEEEPRAARVVAPIAVPTRSLELTR